MIGCNTLSKIINPQPTLQSHVNNIAKDVANASPLSILSLVGGISCLTGIVALVITRGTMGIRAIVIGICLCLLNFIVATYAIWIFVPMIIVTGLVSITWGYITWKQLIKQKD